MWLITGGNGFIGGWLSDTLLRKGYKLRISTRKRLAHNHSDSVYEVGDLGPETVWMKALEGAEGIVHLAGRAHILRETVCNPASEFFRANTEGTIHLAQEAVKAGVRRFVYVSSVGVNGRCTYDLPFKETDIPNPHNDYAESKLAAEVALSEISATGGMEIAIIRPPLVYGPRVSANFLRLLQLVYKGYPLPLGTVSNKRSFLAIQNLVDFLICCMEHPRAAGQTFLVSDGVDLSTPQLIRRIARYMGKRAILVPFPILGLRLAGRILKREALVDSLVGSLQVDISKAKNELGWQPPVAPDESLLKTVQYFLGSQAQ